MYRGVFYHLKSPIEAFEKISSTTAPQGQLHFEGECALHYAEDLTGKPVRVDFTPFNEAGIPIALCYPGPVQAGVELVHPEPAVLEVVDDRLRPGDHPPSLSHRARGAAAADPDSHHGSAS